MSVLRSESGASHRDLDLSLASSVKNCLMPNNGDFLVLTGSYSIEAVTNAPSISHNDIDMNVFTDNVDKSQASAIQKINGLGLSPINQSQSRLEYERGGSLVELEFVLYHEISQGEEGPTFKLPNENGHEVFVPTTQATLLDTNGGSHDFYVKTLSFALATWALRISGVVEAQKRAVRQSDEDHFKVLLQAPHDRRLVLEAITQHPQMPANFACSADTVLDMALRAIKPNRSNND